MEAEGLRFLKRHTCVNLANDQSIRNPETLPRIIHGSCHHLRAWHSSTSFCVGESIETSLRPVVIINYSISIPSFLDQSLPHTSGTHQTLS